jgi:tetratricopeptide (TPR) repeat protein
MARSSLEAGVSNLVRYTRNTLNKLKRELRELYTMLNRSILWTICMVLFVTNAQAASVADLKAANAAAEKGRSDEAVQFFTQALAAGDLSAEDQFIAHKGRGREYSAKSLIADAFDRHDEGHRLRDNAIADFSAVLSLKPDDASIRVDRGQNYHLNQQFDLAIADFTAALTLGPSPSTLVQRAASQRAKGAYEEAIADCTAALASDVRDANLDAWDIYNERGYAEFLAARYDAAAADFDKALALGANSRTDDVLWLPYQMAWLHIAHARAGRNDGEELGNLAGKVNLKQWPGTLIAFFLGQIRLEDVSAASSHGTMGRGRECNLSLFAGEDALAKSHDEQARKPMLRAREVCNIHTLQYLAAGVELGRMKK